MKILLAENEAASCSVLKLTLEKLGHDVTHLRNSDEACEQFRKTQFSIVISDWEGPEIDGSSLFRSIRSLKSRSYTYIMAIMPGRNLDQWLQGMEAGADSIIRKPIYTIELTARLAAAERVLAMQKELRNRSQDLEDLREDLEMRNTQLEEAMTYHTAASRRFQELFEGLPVACFTYDRQGKIHEWNRACETMYGYAAGEVFDRTIWETVRRTEDEAHTRELVSRVFGGESFSGLEWQDRRADGTIIWVQCATFPVRSPRGEVVGAVSANIDITERVRLQQQVARQLEEAQEMNRQLEAQRARLAELATTDGLTGLRNHRFFRELLERSFALASRQSLPLSVVLLDVDKFKQFNDTFGHPAGDEVLREVGRALSESVRDQDTVASYGGEEFVVILPVTDQEGALKAGERFRKAIESRHWSLRGITASIGCATIDGSTKSPSELVDMADRALYHSKESGRNSVTHFANLESPSTVDVAA